MFDEEKLREKEREALEAYLGDKFSFTIPEVAKVFDRSITWTRLQVSSGKLRAIWHSGQQTITRPALIDAYLSGF